MTLWLSRRRLVQQLSAFLGALAVPRAAGAALRSIDPIGGEGSPLTPRPSPLLNDGDIAALTSTSEVTIPPRGNAFMKFSFDFPEPSVSIGDLRIGFMIFTYENAYGLDRSQLKVEKGNDGVLTVRCNRLIWAGGQQTAEGSLVAILRREGDSITWTVRAAAPSPIRAVTSVVRGLPLGQISPSGGTFFDPKDDEVLLAYPFSGGDLFGPGSSGGLTTPQLFVKPPSGPIWSVASRDTRVRTKRLYLQPGAAGYRLELVHEPEGWLKERTVEVPEWRIDRGADVLQLARPHYDHLVRAHRIPTWDSRADTPAWMRETALVLTLHGMHYTGYIFNDYARMLEIVRWVAERIPGQRVLTFLSSWDGRYYWDYPRYEPSARMGGSEGFRTLVSGAHDVGVKVMPMFGANSANRKRAGWPTFADAATRKPDGDQMDINWVDWDNDRHQDGWLTYMNLGVASWRKHMVERISHIVSRYGVDAYFLDIVGGWVNNDKADMHEGTRLLVEELGRRHPGVPVVGEMHYDALLGFIPMFHSFGAREVAPIVKQYARFFQHLSHPAPGRGSSGVHESGFGTFNPRTLSLSDLAIPTLNIVDDTFGDHKTEMEAVIAEARRRAGL